MATVPDETYIGEEFTVSEEMQALAKAKHRLITYAIPAEARSAHDRANKQKRATSDRARTDRNTVISSIVDTNSLDEGLLEELVTSEFEGTSAE